MTGALYSLFYTLLIWDCADDDSFILIFHIMSTYFFNVLQTLRDVYMNHFTLLFILFLLKAIYGKFLIQIVNLSDVKAPLIKRN